MKSYWPCYWAWNTAVFSLITVPIWFHLISNIIILPDINSHFKLHRYVTFRKFEVWSLNLWSHHRFFIVYYVFPSYDHKQRLPKAPNKNHPLVILDVKSSQNRGACLTVEYLTYEKRNSHTWERCQESIHALCKKGIRVI